MADTTDPQVGSGILDPARAPKCPIWRENPVSTPDGLDILVEGAEKGELIIRFWRAVV